MIYTLIALFIDHPKPQTPLSPFAGSKLRQLLTDAGAEAPNADALATETPTPKSGKKPKAKAKASFAEASSNVTGLH